MEKIVGIVTDLVKHSDRHNVVTLFTRSQGRVSLLSPAGNGKQARMRNAALTPLNIISADVNFKGSRELPFLGQFTRESLWKDLYFNPVKSAIGLFIAEFVNAYTRQSPPDARLWDFLAQSVARLDAASKGLANFHLGFMVEFLHYAGIRPDLNEWREDAWFDMRGGTMTILPPTHRDYLSPQEALALPLLARMDTRTYSVFRMTGETRRLLLRGLLRYYAIHFPGLGNLKSPTVLAEVFK